MKKLIKNENKNKPDYVLIILFVILIIVLVILVVTKIKNKGTLKTDDKLVVELHDYFSTESLEDCKGLFNYSNSKIGVDDIDNLTKLCVAYNKSDVNNIKATTHKIDEDSKSDQKICTVDGMIFRADDDKDTCAVKEIDKDIINNTYKKIFGANPEEVTTFNTNGTTICYLKNDKYYCGLAETFTIKMGNDVTIYRVVDSAKKDGDTLVMYDYFVRKVLDVCYDNYTTQNTNELCTKNLKKNLDYNFIKKYGVKYKHIYKKAEDGTYYWVSSEPIEDPND